MQIRIQMQKQTQTQTQTQIQITMISHLKLDIQVDCWPKVVEADESVARDVDPVFHDTVSHL